MDECERVEVERAFSHAKAKFGMGIIWARLEGTTKTVVALYILALNLSKVLRATFAPSLDSLEILVS